VHAGAWRAVRRHRLTVDRSRPFQTAAGIALRRIGKPEDVADVICFLASEAARHITDEVISVSGSPGHLRARSYPEPKANDSPARCRR
jgi:NAD(P)-dependent dehydrogenase (short-subunit alcohol dehydrogenase family)